ncbi:MAG: RHS repeat protein, partial [Butyrivibrio sp.]|nr:RHS repeat protein [Butyrivibrio sp.]
MANTGNGSGAEWHHAKIRDYFNRCFDEIYTPFLEVSDDLVTALTAFVNDDEHKGAEAEQSKLFVNDMQIGTVQDTIYDIQLLCGLMQGEGFEEGVPLLEKFLEEVDEDENTVIKSLQIEKVIKDFKEYSKGFKAIYPEVKSLRDEVVSVANGCDVISRSVWTDPDPKPSEDNFDAFVDLEGESGSIQVFYKKFCDFLETHNDDISGSNFKTILDGIVNNLNSIINGLGDGSFDITRYTETKDNIKWTNVKDLLDGDDLKKYLEYMKSYSLYLQGLIPRCQVYKYDPVNMSSGNYINDRTDLTVAGRHPLVFRRFYNAQSDLSGILGKGWTTGFDVKFRKNEDDDTLKAVYNDGHEGIYKKETIRDEEVYVEIHGEEGIVREVSDGHVLVRNDGSYEKYDAEGFLVATGDIRSNRDYNDASFEDMFNTCKDEHTKISYENFDLNGKETVLPVKVTTGEGKYLSFSYNPDGTLKEVNDNTGRCLGYSYETRALGDNKEHFLTAVTYPNGSTRRYEYNKQGLICSVTSPDGIVALTNEYDEKRRVIHQSFPDGGEMSYSYDDEEHITTATEQNGLKVEYLSDERGRHTGTRYVGVEPGDTVQDENNKDKIVEEYYTYNERNQKTSVTDKNGHVTRYSYDNRGHLTGIVGPEGLHESYTYNADGKLTSKKDSEGNQYKYAYDTEGNLYSVTDPEGNKTRYDYEDGKVVSIRDAAGGITSLTYDENGNINTITDKAGVTTTYECDSLGRVLATIDALGNRTEYTLDSSDNITSVTDPLGNRTSYTYNSAGLLTQPTNPDGTTRTWAYNEIGRPAFYTDEEDRTTAVFYNKSWKEEKITLPNGGDILYTYDLLGNRIAVTDPEGRKTTYTHDRAGNVLSVGKGNATTYAYTYDSRNRIKTEVDGEGNTTAYEYDKNGKVTCITDALGGKTYQEFDGLGRLIVRKDPVGRVIRYTYNSCGMLESTTDAAGVVTKNYYKNDRLIKVTECKKEVDGTLSTEQVICAFEYDECGRVSKRTERDGFFINVSYDGAGRVVCIDCSNNRKLEYKYDSCGRRISISDCGIETRYTYTGTGKIKSILDALGNETRYEYTETDHIKSITRKDLSQAQGESLHSEKFGVGQDGHVTFFEYDLTGNITCEIDALGQKTVYQYDDKGDLCQKTDRDGNDTVYTRDNNGNIIGIDYSDGTRVTYSYNALKVLQEVKDKLGTTRIVSDCLGRTTNVINPDGNTVGYEYDIHDKKAAVIYPDGKRAEYEYDAYGRLTALMDGSDTPITYDYDESGRLKCKNFPNGTSTEYDYYAGGQLKSLTSRDINGLLDRYEYKYNERGNNTQTVRTRRELDNLSGVFDYSYDVLGRLTGVSRNGMQTAAYAYDAFGNRIRSEEEGFTTEYNYDALDRLIQKTELKEDMPAQLMAYSYDKRGNLVSETRNGELYRSYAYGITGMLEKSILDPSNELETTISYAYNFMDQRVSKTTSTDNISYLSDVTRDHFNVLAEESSEGVKRYIYDDNVVSFEKSGVRNYYQQDELGSTMYLTGTDGVSYSPYAYDTFGKRINPATGKLEHGYTKNGNII